MKKQTRMGRPLSDPLRGKKIKRTLCLHRDVWDYLSRIGKTRSESIEKLIRERGKK